jgi:hypothetical protein
VPVFKGRSERWNGPRVTERWPSANLTESPPGTTMNLHFPGHPSIPEALTRCTGCARLCFVRHMRPSRRASKLSKNRQAYPRIAPRLMRIQPCGAMPVLVHPARVSGLWLSAVEELESLNPVPAFEPTACVTSCLANHRFCVCTTDNTPCAPRSARRCGPCQSRYNTAANPPRCCLAAARISSASG